MDVFEAGPGPDVPDLIPARMLNEFVYCPRLGYLEWVHGEFADNLWTEDGRYQHRRVDQKEDAAPAPEDEQPPQASRSVLLSAFEEGLIARIDVLETEGLTATPVDYKRGGPKDVPGGVHEPERVQLCAQGLILRENRFECREGIIYFTEARKRVKVLFDSELVARTRAHASAFRTAALANRIPPPLEDSPKCNACSLVGICLPDENRVLRENPPAGSRDIRRLMPARNEGLPVYVVEQGARIGKKGENLTVQSGRTSLGDIHLFETSQLNVMGNVQVTTQAVRELCHRGIPIAWYSSGGWFYGLTHGSWSKNVYLRLSQYQGAIDPRTSLALARSFISAKILNCRTLLRRNSDIPEGLPLDPLKVQAESARESTSQASLLGIEGTAARIYFQHFTRMIKDASLRESFGFKNRNRRPPKDPINAMLSLAYSLLSKEVTITLAAVGFDPFLGFMHQPRYGRPALALDLMEEFRPLVADSTVIRVINNGEIKPEDFIRTGIGVALTPRGRRAFIQAYERRMDQLIRHPIFGYQVSYHQVLNIQARLLGQYLSGELTEYPAFLTR